MAEKSGSSLTLEADPPSTSPSRGTPAPHVRRRFNLLLAEDNLPDALLIREAIEAEHLPFEVFVATDGQEAIDFIAAAEADSRAPCPEFLVLDLNLPRRNGFEVLHMLREGKKCKDVPVLVVTSSDSQLDRQEAAAMGAGYFRKPPSYQGFLRVGEVLRGMLGDR